MHTHAKRMHVHPGDKLPDSSWPGTREELSELWKAVFKHWGPCKCHPAYDAVGRVSEIHICDMHAWLTVYDDEPGRPAVEFTGVKGDAGWWPHHREGVLLNCVTRLSRLLFVRRTNEKWRHAEHGEACPICQDVMVPEAVPAHMKTHE